MLGILLEIGINVLLFGWKSRTKPVTVLIITVIVLTAAIVTSIRNTTF